jgi:predicted ribosomally synthesized peptide with nif11-like leader
MSKVREFYEALSKDEAMQERAKGMKAAGETTAEAAVEATITFAQAEGYSFTAEELKDYGKELKDYGKELSDEELAAVAGGAGNDTCWVCGMVLCWAPGNNDVCACFLDGFGGIDGSGGKAFSCVVKGTYW